MQGVERFEKIAKPQDAGQSTVPWTCSKCASKDAKKYILVRFFFAKVNMFFFFSHLQEHLQAGDSTTTHGGSTTTGSGSGSGGLIGSFMWGLRGLSSSLELGTTVELHSQRKCQCQV